MALASYTVRAVPAPALIAEGRQVQFTVFFTSSNAISSPEQIYSVDITPGDDNPTIKAKVQAVLERAAYAWDQRQRVTLSTFNLASDFTGTVQVPDDPP